MSNYTIITIYTWIYNFYNGPGGFLNVCKSNKQLPPKFDGLQQPMRQNAVTLKMTNCLILTPPIETLGQYIPMKIMPQEHLQL